MNSLFWFCFAKSEQSRPLALLGVFAKAKLLPKACKQLLCSPFGLVYSNNGKRITRFFETDETREDFIATHSFLKDEGFKDFLELSPQVIADVVAISKLLPADVSFMDMYKFWQKAHKSISVMTVFEACDAYVRDMRKIGRQESHIVRVRRILESFCDTFYKVKAKIANRTKKYTDESLLEFLKYLYEKNGYLSGIIINECIDTPSSAVYVNSFGSLLRAYELVGYIPEHDYRYLRINKFIRALHSDIISDIENQINKVGATFRVDAEFDGIRWINEGIRIKTIMQT